MSDIYDVECESLDDANPLNAAVLDVVERIHEISEGLTRGEMYPNRDFDCGMLEGARQVLEAMLDPQWPKLKAAHERWINDRLLWALSSKPEPPR